MIQGFSRFTVLPVKAFAQGIPALHELLVGGCVADADEQTKVTFVLDGFTTHDFIIRTGTDVRFTTEQKDTDFRYFLRRLEKMCYFMSKSLHFSHSYFTSIEG